MERVAGIIIHLPVPMPVSYIIISLHNISNIKFLIVKSFFRDYTKKNDFAERFKILAGYGSEKQFYWTIKIIM